ncbi:MAG: hypothetical protein Q9225_004403, partial [Loekoesia sp. 1 TL-2023]
QAQQAQAQAQADALAATHNTSTISISDTPAQEHPQELLSPEPPSIAVTHPDDEDTDSSDDGIVTMQIPTHNSNDNRGATAQKHGEQSSTHHDLYGISTSGGGGGNSSDEDDDAETEEMKFGGEGLEGFVHSPRGEEEGGGEGSGDEAGLVMGREEGHEEDLGRRLSG